MNKNKQKFQFSKPPTPAASAYVIYEWSLSILTTSGWFFFVLINAYYGGALTMFFVSEITLPFNTIRDALKAFPSWNFMYQAGNDAYFEIPASQVIAA